MYKNLLAEMGREGITKWSIMEFLKVTYPTVLRKISGETPPSVDEAIMIKNNFFPDKTIEYLFKTFK